MISRAYRATGVNDVKWDEIARGKEGLGITLGVDVGERLFVGGLSLGRWSVHAPGVPKTHWRFPA